MPHRSLRPCGIRGCPGLTREGRYCASHAASEQQRYESKRGTAAQRGYDRTWRKVRAAYLAAYPYCADPFGVHAQAGELARATDVDHIVAKRRGGTDDWANLRGLCHACHSRHTAVKESGWGDGGRDL